ncbi:MAG: FHA domain-containing protein [Myxococcota bacterium]|nr:FHA domain-containing protein [Myxococcota bacterium]
MLRLVIEDGEGTTHVVPLARDEITVGRQEGNTIRLTERNVSRMHARFTIGQGSDDETVLLEDLHSYNGVRVNGERIVGKCSLAADDSIQIGDYILVLEAQANAVDTAVTDTVVTRITDVAKTKPVELGGAECARLVVVSSNLAGQVYHLTQKEILVGRHQQDGNDVAVTHRSISRNHAKLIWRDNRFTVIDLGSANGIIVNGQAQTTCSLVNGDIVEMGHVKLRFCGPGDPYVFTPADIDDVILPPSSQLLRHLAVAVILVGMVLIGYILAEVTRDNRQITSATAQADAKAKQAQVNPTPQNAKPDIGPPIRIEAQTDHSETLAAGERALNARDWRTAIEHFERILQAEPDHEKAREFKERASDGQLDSVSFSKLRQLVTNENYEKALRIANNFDRESAYLPDVTNMKNEVQRLFLNRLETRVERALARDRLTKAREHLNAARRYSFARAAIRKLERRVTKATKSRTDKRDNQRAGGTESRRAATETRDVRKRVASTPTVKPAPSKTTASSKPRSCSASVKAGQRYKNDPVDRDLVRARELFMRASTQCRNDYRKLRIVCMALLSMGAQRQARRPCDRVSELISDLAKRNQWERYLEKKGLR